MSTRGFQRDARPDWWTPEPTARETPKEPGFPGRRAFFRAAVGLAGASALVPALAGSSPLTAAPVGGSVTATLAAARPQGPEGVRAVTSFGAVGDGVAQDDEAIAAAIAWRDRAQGRALDWPPGEYLTARSVANLHAGRNTGLGRIRRGSGLFWIEPPAGERNVLHVGPAGREGNDGLSPADALPSPQAAFDILEHHGPVLRGRWRLSLAPGRYRIESTQVLESDLRGLDRIEISGARNGPDAEPTVVLDCGGGEHSAFLFTNSNVDLRDIRIVNSAARTGGGVIAQSDCDLVLVNVHTENCTEGVRAAFASQLRVVGGSFVGGVNGIVAVGAATYTVGYGASSLAEGPRISGNSGAGILAAESANGHVDHTILERNGRGVVIQTGAHAHIRKCDIRENMASGVRCQNSTFYDNENVYTANGLRFEIEGSGGELRATENTAQELLVASDWGSHAAAGAAGQVVVASPYTVPVGYLDAPGKLLRVRVRGTKSGSAGDAVVGLLLGAEPVREIALAGDTGGFRLDFTVAALGPARQVTAVEGVQHDRASLVLAPASSFVSMASPRAVGIAVTLAAAADTITVASIEVWRVG